MPVITKHRYIENYPIKKNDKYLILGTIHPQKNPGTGYQLIAKCNIFN